ncbi:MAG TPA: glycosyltransferase family 4 protein, partial [Acidimicrobiales bacterium]|nr:glycosyltransferase family 4 protein [Acidimicrobiales bacterium]
MRIAMLGHRGVPARYSGIERHVEEIGARLAARGHNVVVFCRTNGSRDRPETYRGMSLAHLPAITTKHLETITHTGLSTLRAMRGFDVVHFHAVGPGLLAPLPRYLSGARVVQTVHGFDADRAKWGATARRVLQVAQHMSARVPDATITVSRFLQDEYRRRYRRETIFIPHGVIQPEPRPAHEIMQRYDLRPGGYVLFVGRLVPEK